MKYDKTVLCPFSLNFVTENVLWNALCGPLCGGFELVPGDNFDLGHADYIALLRDVPLAVQHTLVSSTIRVPRYDPCSGPSRNKVFIQDLQEAVHALHCCNQPEVVNSSNYTEFLVSPGGGVKEEATSRIVKQEQLSRTCDTCGTAISPGFFQEVYNATVRNPLHG